MTFFEAWGATWGTADTDNVYLASRILPIVSGINYEGKHQYSWGHGRRAYAK